MFRCETIRPVRPVFRSETFSPRGIDAAIETPDGTPFGLMPPASLFRSETFPSARIGTRASAATGTMPPARLFRSETSAGATLASAARAT
ncbi:hypothetical protein [Limimaricola pyoseonensis]|uniref:hypothetical protein n=1 Tax=Limimaricola pyoseonensis TaxID=521013 RepID=UPI001041DCC2|nr:hypothetical protein [Limimaricola pyoseonensis]